MEVAERSEVSAVRWAGEVLELLDQRVLPETERYLRFAEAGEVAEAIRDMVVRGAPAIGVSAAYGVVLSARRRYREAPGDWREAMGPDLAALRAARPTAVNLGWALDRMQACAFNINGDPEPALLAEAFAIHDEDVAANRRMGALGAALIEAPCAVLTHCNAGALATAGYGTALGVVRSAHAAGLIRRVYADETRPWFQGARLTAWELGRDGIPVTVITDSAAAQLMRREPPDWAIVGADRVAANGDVVNKIGTYGLAVVARHHGVKFMVVAPSSTLDPATPDGDAVPIEQRDAAEIWAAAGGAPVGAEAVNPAFDVTPAALVDVLVTERGVAQPPSGRTIAALLRA